MINPDRLREVLSYEPATGIFTRLVSSSSNARAGDIAGSRSPRGYWQIMVDGKLYLAHRLAWLHVHGCWPNQQLDHINGVQDDNRIANLRQCTQSENLQNRPKQSNNASGYIGVSFDSASRKWRAQIGRNGQKHHLGFFGEPETAYEAYLAAKASMHQFQPIPRNLEH